MENGGGESHVYSGYSGYSGGGGGGGEGGAGGGGAASPSSSPAGVNGGGGATRPINPRIMWRYRSISMGRRDGAGVDAARDGNPERRRKGEKEGDGRDRIAEDETDGREDGSSR